ncbi:MAG: ATP-binding cassette domain-containing protein [Thermodesulfovibrionales bacterium]
MRVTTNAQVPGPNPGVPVYDTPISSEIAISVKKISKIYHLYDSPKQRLKEALHPLRKKYHRDFWALRDVSFDVKKGEVVGIIGRNGSGKSTLLQMICGILLPSEGIVTVNGRISALLELGTGFNPEYTGRQNIYMNGTLLGFTRDQMDEKFQAIERFADIGEFIEQPVKTYSSGMFVRLAFAAAVSVDPDILIIDEALAVGDVFFRQKCYKRFEDMRSKGVTVILVSHAMTEIAEFCDRVVLLEKGALYFIGHASEGVKRYYILEQKVRMARPHGQSEKAIPVGEEAFDHNCHKGESILIPSPDAYLDIENVPAVSNGWAECTGVALCNSRGEPARIFEQGERAIFYSEYIVHRDIEVPVGGLVIKNEKNVILHGKSSLEYGSLAPSNVAAGTTVSFIQEIDLRIAAGDYTFDLGLSALPQEVYNQRSLLPHAVLRSRILRICHLSNAGTFTVVLRNTYDNGQLMHHGLCDLPGSMSVRLKNADRLGKAGQRATHPKTRTNRREAFPAVFHITHWKAGSQWIYKLLSDCAPDLIIAPIIGVAHFTNGPLIEGKIYPTLYLTKEQFYNAKLPDLWKSFIIVRDLRDTLISAYFSMLHSHKVISPVISELRSRLQSMSMTDGMIYMLHEWLPASASIQRSWQSSGELIIRYEDLLVDDVRLLEHVLIDCCKLPITARRLKEVVLAHRFESMTGGRQRGVEDILSHQRKAIAGDWRQYFTEEIKKDFKARFGDLLVATGYEKDHLW